MTFLICLLALFFSIVGYLTYFGHRRRSLSARSWEEMLATVQPIDLEGIRSIADCYLRPDGDQLRVEPDEMWRIVGGLEGIGRLKANARVMLELAVFAERWNWEQGPVIAEMIRRDALRLNKAVFRIELALIFRFGFVRSSFNLQEAASSYYLIRGRLLGLYRVTHIALLPHLEAAL